MRASRAPHSARNNGAAYGEPRRLKPWMLILVPVIALALLGGVSGAAFARSDTAAPAAAPPSAAQAQTAPVATWTQVHQLPAGQYFYGVYFVNTNVGYAVSGPDWNVNNGSGAPTYISKTTDGGKTWTSKAIANTDGWMRGITCTDVNNCWIAGKVRGRILRTQDGGNTWNTIANNSGYPNWLWSAGPDRPRHDRPGRNDLLRPGRRRCRGQLAALH